MTDSSNDIDPRARRLADACRRLVVGGVADNQTAYETVMAEEKGRSIAQRLNAERGQNQPPKQETKKP